MEGDPLGRNLIFKWKTRGRVHLCLLYNKLAYE